MFFFPVSLATEKVLGLFVPQNPPFQYAKKEHINHSEDHEKIEKSRIP